MIQIMISVECYEFYSSICAIIIINLLSHDVSYVIKRNIAAAALKSWRKSETESQVTLLHWKFLLSICRDFEGHSYLTSGKLVTKLICLHVVQLNFSTCEDWHRNSIKRSYVRSNLGMAGDIKRKNLLLVVFWLNQSDQIFWHPF